MATNTKTTEFELAEGAVLMVNGALWVIQELHIEFRKPTPDEVAREASTAPRVKIHNLVCS